MVFILRVTEGFARGGGGKVRVIEKKACSCWAENSLDGTRPADQWGGTEVQGELGKLCPGVSS